MGLIYRVAKLPNYIKRFGITNGLYLASQIERSLPKQSDTVQAYRVPGFISAVHLRNIVSDHAIFWQCLVMQQYDTRGFPQNDRLMASYRDMVERGQRPLIIDCGANIGLATVWFAKQFPEALIYAIEPDGRNFEILRMNTEALGGRVVCIQGGVWPTSATLRITNPDSGAAAFRVLPADVGDREALRAYTIEEIVQLAGMSSAFIVKIDIEGAQSELFRCNTTWVKDTHLISLELDDWLLPWQGTSRAFFSCVSQCAFDYLIRGENIFCFRDFKAAGQANCVLN